MYKVAFSGSAVEMQVPVVNSVISNMLIWSTLQLEIIFSQEGQGRLKKACPVLAPYLKLLPWSSDT